MGNNAKPPRELIYIAKLADGREVYTVICPGCQVDLSKVCSGRHVFTREGKLVEIRHPLRCPDCGYYLLETVPLSRIVQPG